MKQISAITEQHALNTTLLELSQANTTTLITLWDLIAKARSHAVDITALGGNLHWNHVTKAIKITRKIGILHFTYDKTGILPWKFQLQMALGKLSSEEHYRTLKFLTCKSFVTS